MPDEIIADAAEAQKKAATEAAAKEAAEIVAKEVAAAKPDPFADELKILTKAKEKAEALNVEKSKAIEAERRARKTAEAEVEKMRQAGTYLTREDAEKMVQEAVAKIQPNANLKEEAVAAAREVAQSERRFQLIEKAGATPSERELIKYHLENTVKPSGDLSVDIGRAKFLAAEASLRQAAKEKGAEHLGDVALASLLGSSSGSRPSTEVGTQHSVETQTLAKLVGLDPNKLPKKS